MSSCQGADAGARLVGRFQFRALLRTLGSAHLHLSPLTPLKLTHDPGGGHRFSDRGLSASRVKQSYQVLDQVLRYAIRARRLTVNPAADIELPGIREPEKRYLTMRQVQELAIASGRFRTLVFVLALCGLRFGEATALRTKHVDLDSARIWVSASATHVAGKGIVETDTKNHEGRKVPIPAFLVELLRTELPTEPEALVFAGREGKHLPSASSDGRLTGLRLRSA